MFVKIPFEKIIEFKTNIYEITKMSLEHDFNVNDGVVLGNFYISGEYRSHEVSVNKEDFNYTIPFTVDVTESIKYGTMEFNIEDFTYEIVDNNSLKVNIVYSLKAELDSSDELFERINEDELSSELEFIDSFLDKENEDNKEEKEDDNNEKLVEENKSEVSREDEDDKKEEEVKEVEEKIEDEMDEVIEDKDEKRLNVEEEKTIMETIKNSDDTFVTYHIHIVKESETIESICNLYKVPSSLISEYNSIDNIVAGDKIVIPKLDE